MSTEGKTTLESTLHFQLPTVISTADWCEILEIFTNVHGDLALIHHGSQNFHWAEFSMCRISCLYRWASPTLNPVKKLYNVSLFS